MGSFGVSCRAGGGGSFLYGPAAIHGAPSREEEARLNQWCLRERERGWLQTPCFLQHLPAFELIFDDPVERQGWLEPARFAAVSCTTKAALPGFGLGAWVMPTCRCPDELFCFQEPLPGFVFQRW